MKKLYFPIVLLTLFANFAFAQTYVTATGAGSKDGTSWANAYDGTQLQTAINAAASGTQVWVAKGIYKPTESLSTTGFLTDGITAVTARDNAFILKAGVEIYGGFAGGEAFGVAAIAGRNLVLNETILSGDLNNSNVADSGDSYHVVAARNDANGTVLDGFTIQHGYGNDSGYVEIEGGDQIRRNMGGAIAFISSKTLTFKNLWIKNNKTNNAGGAIYSKSINEDAKFNFINVSIEDNEAPGIGGAIYAIADLGASQLNFTNCVFLNNKAGGGTGGGAMYFAGASTNTILNITNSRFENNQTNHTAITYAGALRVNTGIANIINTIFKGNKAGSDSDGRGGAIYSTGGSIVNAEGCTFENNSSTGDGGHWTVFSGVSTVSNSTFRGGFAATMGGAVYLATAATLNISSSTFSGNSSVAQGGAIYQIGSTSILNITTSTFENNKSTTTTGGAIYFYTGTASVSGSIFKGNLATTNGGALYNLASTVEVKKSRFYSNTANTSGGAFYIYAGNTSPSVTTISNSIFYDNYAKTTTTGGVGGGAIFQSRQTAGSGSTATVINSVFYANKSANENPAYSFGGFIDVKVNLYNNIFYANLGNYDEITQTGLATADIRRSSGATTAIQVYTNNLFQASIATATNRTVTNAFLLNSVTPEPLFASTTSTDFNFLYPTSDSFVIDKGSNSLYAGAGDINTDTHLAGYARLNGATIDLGAIEYAAVLPVTISNFSAKLVNNRTQLNWTVGNEDNVNRYEVERSQNGVDFSRVATVTAKSTISYGTVDAAPQNGVNYYRLKTVDNDGKFSYYGSIQTVKVTALDGAGVSVYPNPVKGANVNVTMGLLTSGKYQYTIVNAAGIVAQRGNVSYDGNKNISLTTTLPAGLYVLHLENGAVKVATKLIKQ